jgi:energy-coupling factor transporter ATP-binding protein EcfA2
VPTIEAERLRKEFGDTVAVDDLTLAIDEGEFFGLLGPNGAGKTTALLMLTTLLRPTSGTARVVGILACLALSACQRGSPSAAAESFEEPGSTRVSAETTLISVRGRYAIYRIRLRNDHGLSSTGRLVRPAAASVKRRYPAVLLEDGRELNSRAVEFLPADFGDVVVLSLDYPDELPYVLSVREIILESDRLRRASRRIAPMFSLGADYLVTRADVDPARVVMVASSFAVPFAVQAAASDTRFVNVGLIYGAGDMAQVLAANLSIRPRWLRRPAAWIAMRPFAEFAAERHVSRIAPRPIVMVNGVDDPQMPRRAVQTLYDSARPPKTMVWLRTGHLMPDDSALVRVLVDTTLALLPALRQVTTLRRELSRPPTRQ